MKRLPLQYAEEIAKLLPLSGCSTGTGKPCLNFFNRGAEPLVFDPIADRLRNAHAMIFGPPGSGKSAWLTNSLDAVYAPPGQKVAIHLETQINLDQDAQGRRIDYSTQTTATRLD